MEFLMKKELNICFAIIVLVVLISSCTSLMEKTGQLLDGTSRAAKKIASFQEINKLNGVFVKQMRRKDGSEFLAISVGNIPNITFHASMPDSNGQIFLTSYTFLCSSVFGWNEFTMDISASGTFINNGNNASLHINNPIEVIGISSGKIRYNNERLIDDSAMRSLNNRYERILALVEWMKTQSDVPAFYRENNFQSYWQKIILPESVSAKKRPVTWNKNDTEWNRADDINWNVAYTKKIFSEDLYVYRNSGGLLRDFEEALGWIYLEYKWDDLCNQLSNTIYLKKDN
jgi:hypothetical protein